MVSQIILISNINETFSTYQTSNSSLSFQLSAFLPFTCAHPVIPGLTSCLLDWRLSYKGKYFYTVIMNPECDEGNIEYKLKITPVTEKKERRINYTNEF